MLMDDLLKIWITCLLMSINVEFKQNLMMVTILYGDESLVNVMTCL